MTTPFQFTLEDLQRLPYGDWLDQGDVNYANEILAKGVSPDHVRGYAMGWGQEIARVSECEGREARDFEDRAYGRD